MDNSGSSTSGGNSGPPPPNPVLSAYENFVQTTPFVTRFVLSAWAVTYLTSWTLISPSMILSCIPYYTIYRLQVYRIVTSPLVSTSIISLVFCYVGFIDCGKRLEHGLGSAAFGLLLLILTVLTNVSYLAIALLLFGSEAPSTGTSDTTSGMEPDAWMLLLSVIALQCSSAPPENVRYVFHLAIKTRYYPLVLLGIVSLFCGLFRVVPYALAVGVGYAYGFGYLDRLKVGQERLTAWESGFLATFVTRRGWVAGHAASGSNAWALPLNNSTSSGGGGNGGGWSPASFFQGRQQQTDDSASASEGTASTFPTSGGRTLGGSSSSDAGGAIRRTAPKTDEARHAAMAAAAERRAKQQRSAEGDVSKAVTGISDDV
mmetsp:Transcript_23939/g.53012  ORF Transcript_23939/g.53012 Transcript_23939/m.53012 type:complete len:373 (-) Transcript_23939:155-1273(-)